MDFEEYEKLKREERSASFGLAMNWFLSKSARHLISIKLNVLQHYNKPESVFVKQQVGENIAISIHGKLSAMQWTSIFRPAIYTGSIKTYGNIAVHVVKLDKLPKRALIYF